MVNILDMENPNDDPAFKLENIFAKQEELIEKYHPIEMKSGLRLTAECPINLHMGVGQSVIKDYAWRFTEELGEALEAYNLHMDNPDHYIEELSDSLHFLVELTIHAGYGPSFLSEKEQFKLEALFEEGHLSVINNEEMPIGLKFNTTSYGALLMATGITIESMAKTCNTLKNKPWKQTHMLTDIKRFEQCLRETWLRFFVICSVAKLSEEDLFNVYTKKYKVNEFRQNSKY